jgi:hypothetical protein
MKTHLKTVDKISRQRYNTRRSTKRHKGTRVNQLAPLTSDAATLRVGS